MLMDESLFLVLNAWLRQKSALFKHLNLSFVSLVIKHVIYAPVKFYMALKVTVFLLTDFTGKAP